MDIEVFKQENVLFNNTVANKEDALKEVAKLAFKNKFVEVEDRCFNSLLDREKVSTTAFKNGIAIPHCVSKNNLKTGLFAIRFKNPLNWESLDNKPIFLTLGLCIPEKGENTHLDLLIALTKKIMDEDFTKSLVSSNSETQLFNLINNIDVV